MPTRRALLFGGVGAIGVVGLGAAGVEEGALPGRTRLHALLGAEGVAGVVPDEQPGRVETGSFVSVRRGGVRTGWSVAHPPGAPSRKRLCVLVFLHGLGGSHVSAFGRAHLGLDRFLAQEVRRHGRRFAIASVDGGTTYWHRRPDGEDAGAMVLDEFLPLLHDKGLRTDRIGLMGYSMGGYAALRLGGLLGADRCAVVVAESPALWTDPASASQSGFADAAEYTAASVFGRQTELAGIPVRIDCGRDDPFHAATRAYVAGFPAGRRPLAGYQPGAHTQAYWRRMAPAQLAFVGRHLTTA